MFLKIFLNNFFNQMKFLKILLNICTPRYFYRNKYIKFQSNMGSAGEKRKVHSQLAPEKKKPGIQSKSAERSKT